MLGRREEAGEGGESNGTTTHVGIIKCKALANWLLNGVVVAGRWVETSA